MERRFLYPGLAENRYPSDVVYRTTDVEDRRLPYRELRANDHSSFQAPHRVIATDVYSAQPMIGGDNAVPWWTNIGLRPVDEVSLRSRNLQRDENLEAKLVKDSEFPADKNSKLIKKTREPQLWRKISDPRRAILTETNGKLVWREINDVNDKSKTVATQAVEVQPSRDLRSIMPVRRAPYMVYT